MPSFNITEEADVSFIKYILSICSQWEQYMCTEKELRVTPHTDILSTKVLLLHL